MMTRANEFIENDIDEALVSSLLDCIRKEKARNEKKRRKRRETNDHLGH